MPRSIKDSDDEAESKTGHIPTRMLSAHMVNSPLRRSSRIKQAKTSPGSSESDTSNNSQPIRFTRQRTATMDSIETVKKRLRHTSLSSDLNEATDVDVGGTPKKRITRNSLNAITTSTNINTRATNKRLTRAGSEAKSSPHVRTYVRKTRSNSVEPESLQEKNNSQPDTPVRIRRRASMLPSGSPVKEEIEERNVTPVRLNPTITEIDEFTSTDKIAIVPVLLKSDEILSLSQNKDNILSEHMDQVTMNKEQTLVKGQSSSEESLDTNVDVEDNNEMNLLPDTDINDENSIHDNSSNLLKSNKEDKPKKSLLQIEQSLIVMCQDSCTKDLAGNSLNTFIEENKESPSKKDQMSNIISDTSTNKKTSITSNVVLLNTKSPSSTFVSELDEKEKESEETNKISLMNQTETQKKNVDKINLDIDVDVEDNNEINLIFESLDQHENEVPLNVTNSDNLLDSSINETSLKNSDKQSDVKNEQSVTNDVINSDTVQVDVIDITESTEKEQNNLPEHVTRLQSEFFNVQSTIDFKTNDSDVNDDIILDNQLFDITETSEKPAVDASVDISGNSVLIVSQKTESKDISSKSTLNRKNVSDILEIEEENLQLEMNKKDQADIEIIDENAEIEAVTKLFHDIPADSSDEKNYENDNTANNSLNSNHQSEIKPESEAECDLILIDKQAWLAARNIKNQEEKESFEYDSDDTVLLKSRLDAVRTSCKDNLDSVSEDTIDLDKEDEAVEKITKRKSLTKKRSISKQNNTLFHLTCDSSPEYTNEEDVTVKSKVSLNQSKNLSTSRLNNSKQVEITEQTHDNSNEEIEDDANRLNRSSQVNKKNVSLRKSKDGRKSLNKSLVSSNQDEDKNSAQMISDKNKMDISEEDNTNSLNRSENDKSKMIHDEIANSDESNKCDDGKMAQFLRFKNDSTIAHAGTDIDNHSSNDSVESLNVQSDVQSNSNDDSDNSINSDIKKEYNLDGTKQKFLDDVPGDECRASESEYSDLNDDGSDLASFIVSDDKVEEEEDQSIEDDDESMEKNDENLEVEEVGDITIDETKDKEDEIENEDIETVDIETVSEKDEIENKDEKNDVKTHLHSEEEDENLNEEIDVETIDESTLHKDKMTFTSKLIKSHKIKSSTPKHNTDKRFVWLENTLEICKTISETEDAGSSAKKAVKNTLPVMVSSLKKNTSLKEFNHPSNKEKRLNKSLPSDLPDAKIEKARIVKPNIKTNLARLHKTMNITDDDLSTIRHLRKEKLSESAPLGLDAKITPLKKKSLLREEIKNITQIETQEENNEKEVSNPVMPSTDDTIRKHKRQKKHKKQTREALTENITPEQNQEEIESKTKIKLGNHSPILVAKNTTSENSERINKKKKKKKQIDIIEQNENVNEDSTTNTMLVTQKKKKLVQPTITKDNNSKDLDQINKKKKKKKQIDTIAQEESINESEKNIGRNETELVQRNKKKTNKKVNSLERDSFTDDYMVAKKKRKEKEMLRNKKTLSEESTKNIAQTKKIYKKEEYNQMIPFNDDTIQKRNQKKRKRKVEETLDENVDDEAASQDPIEAQKKIKRVKFVATAEEIKFTTQRKPVAKKETREDLDQINEKRKKTKKKQLALAEQNKNVNEENIRVSTSANKDSYQVVEKKKKKKKQKQLDVIEQDNISKDDTYPSKSVEEKKKKQKQKQFGISKVQDNNTNEDTYASKSIGEKMKPAKHNPTLVIKNNKRSPYSKNENFLSSKPASMDNTIQDFREIIKKKKKKKQLDVTEQDNNSMEDHMFVPEQVKEKKKKKKKKQFEVSQQDNNVNEEDTCAPEAVEKKKKKKKKKNQFDVIQQDNSINEDDMYAPMPVEEKQRKTKKEKQIEQDRNVTELNPKLKLKKNLKSGKKLQAQDSVPNASEYTVFTEAWNEAREAIRAAEMRIKKRIKNNELKKRKRPEENDVENRNVKIKERKKLVSSSIDSVDRLPNDVIENLSDIPKKKKRKFPRNEEQINDSPKNKKSKTTVAKNDGKLSLNVPGSSTQFTVINMQKAKKQPLKGGAAVVASVRQKMLARNKREAVSAYLMYLEKQRAASNKKSVENAF